MLEKVRLTNWQELGKEKLEQVQQFAQENRGTLQTVGIVVLAGATGTAIGMLLGKGVLAIKGAAMAKVSATQAAPLLNPTNAATSLQGTVNLLNSTAVNGAALVDKVTALLNALPGHTVALTAGAVGGGAVGVGVTRRQVRQVQEQLNEQVIQTEAAQAEKARLQSELVSIETNLNELQAKLTIPAVEPAVQAPSTPTTVAQDNLEVIRGIGRVFAQRLNAAGIYTFADLAAQTPQQLRAIIGPVRSAAMVNPEAWIAEARQRITPTAEPTSTEQTAPVPPSDQPDQPD